MIGLKFIIHKIKYVPLLYLLRLEYYFIKPIHLYANLLKSLFLNNMILILNYIKYCGLLYNYNCLENTNIFINNLNHMIYYSFAYIISIHFRNEKGI